MKYLFQSTILATTATGIIVIIKNQAAGLYNSNLDSVALPIITLIIILLALITTYTLQLFLHKKKFKLRIARALLIGLSGLSATFSLMILAASAVYWWLPNHVIISLLYCITIAVFIYSQIIFFIKN
jgi:uncharacterized BrkB/YihY/UPF0761 family membrane protein